MEQMKTIITGSTPKSYIDEKGNEINYYRVSALGTDNKMHRFRSTQKPELQSLAIIEIWKEGDVLWDGSKAERAFNNCVQITTGETLRNAKALLEELSDIVL